MPKKNLPMGDEHDSLSRQADRALNNGQETTRRPASTRRSLPDDGEYPVSSRRHSLDDEYPTRRSYYGSAPAVRRTADPRGSAFYDRGGSPRQTTDSSSEEDGGGSWNVGTFVAVGNVTFTKSQFMDFVNRTMPNLISECANNVSKRGRFLRMTMIPAMIAELERYEFIEKPKKEQKDLPF